MNISQIYIVVSIIGFAVIAFLVFFAGKTKKENKFTPLASLAFVFVLAGLFFGENPFIGYGLIGIGVLLAVVYIFIKRNKAL